MSLSLGSKSVAAGKKQKVKVTTLPGASVDITVTFPNKKKKTHSGTAGSAGTVSWSFTQPSNVTTAKSRSATVKAVATGNGQTVSASKKYTIK